MFFDKADLDGLITSGKILSKILNQIKSVIVNGEKDLFELDKLTESLLKDYNSRSAFKNYQPDFSSTPFPFSICTSINDELVHGLPSLNKTLKEGDIVSIDLGIEHNGWYADSAFTIGIGSINDKNKLLIDNTEKAFYSALNYCTLEYTLGDIGFAIQEQAIYESHSVALGLMGHGIGKELHEKPNVFNYGTRGQGLKLYEGLSICIEPILIDGEYSIVEDEDGWTLRTADKSNAAHYEHSIAITKDGPIILTQE